MAQFDLVSKASKQVANATGVTLWTIEPYSSLVGRAKFALVSGNATFATIVDPIMFHGYNAEVAIGGGLAGEPAFFEGFEGFYRAVNWAGSGITQDTMEWYLEYRNADRSIVDFRPIAMTIGRDNNAARWASVQLEIGTDASNAKSQFFIKGANVALGSTNTTSLLVVTNNFIQANRPVSLNGQTLNQITFPSGKNAHIFFISDDGVGNQTSHWYLGNFGGDPNHYLWNQTNGRFHVKYVKGATDAAALTEFQSSVKVDGNVGFYGTTPVAKPTVTGSRGGNAALASLLTQLASTGILLDSTTA